MCKCLTENVACCCFNCALGVLLSIISTFLVVFIIAGVLVWWFVYHEDNKPEDLVDDLSKKFSEAKEAGGDLIKKLDFN